MIIAFNVVKTKSHNFSNVDKMHQLFQKRIFTHQMSNSALLSGTFLLCPYEILYLDFQPESSFMPDLCHFFRL